MILAVTQTLSEFDNDTSINIQNEYKYTHLSEIYKMYVLYILYVSDNTHYRTCVTICK